MMKMNPLFSLNKYAGLHRGNRDGKKGKAENRQERTTRIKEGRKEGERSIDTMATL